MFWSRFVEDFGDCFTILIIGGPFGCKGLAYSSSLDGELGRIFVFTFDVFTSGLLSSNSFDDIPGLSGLEICYLIAGGVRCGKFT